MATIQNEMRPQQPQAAQAPVQAAPASGGKQADPKAQSAYERVVLAGMKVLYNQKTHGAVMNALKSGKPADALANVVVMIVLGLYKESGGKMPKLVIIPAAAELMMLAAELAEKAGLFKADRSVITSAMMKVIPRIAQEFGATKQDIDAFLKRTDPKVVQKVSAMAQGAAGQPGQAVA
jgi:hypothetical protein